MKDETTSAEPLDSADTPDRARGRRLLNAIRAKQLEQGLSVVDLAELLGYTEKYVNILLRGDRWIGNVGDAKLKRIAKFLELPVVSIYVLADVLAPDDFFDARVLGRHLEDTYKRLRDDSVFLPYTPEKPIWDSAHEQVRVLCSVLYTQVVMDRGDAARVESKLG